MSYMDLMKGMRLTEKKTRVVFMGTPDMAVPSLEGLSNVDTIEIVGVYTQPDRPAGRKRQIREAPVAAYARSQGLLVLQPEKIREPEAFAALKELRPELIIVCAYGQILPQELLDLPPLGCFNLHFSRLPQWRGASPIQAAILHGDSDTAICLQKMVLKLDAGPIVAMSDAIPIGALETSESLGSRLSQESGRWIVEQMPMLLEQTFSLTPQNEEQATYCRIIKKQEGAILWQEDDAQTVLRKSLAYDPWPGIFCSTTEGLRLQLHDIEVLPDHEQSPGMLTDDGIIGCRQGAVRVVSVTPAGKRQMPFADFLRGQSHLIGATLN